MEEGRKGHGGGKRLSLCCRAAAQCNRATNRFSKENIPCCLKNTFPLKTRGGERASAPCRGRTTLKTKAGSFQRNE